MDSGASFSHLATLGQEQALGRVDLAELDPGRIAGFPRLVSLNGSRLLVAWTEPGSQGPRVRAAELIKP